MPSTASTADTIVDPDLIAGLDRVWSRLGAAVADSASPLRTPVVVTAGGSVADGRLMVLRGIDPAAATLTFFTDVRAGKVAAAGDAPRVAVVAYDPHDRLQLRLRGTATIAAAGPEVDAAWAAVADASRRAYRTAAPPGAPTGSPAEAARLGDADGRDNFAILTVTLTEVEWLELAVAGHRRASYRWAGATWQGCWQVP